MTAAEGFLSPYWGALLLIAPIFQSLICGFRKAYNLA